MLQITAKAHFFSFGSMVPAAASHLSQLWERRWHPPAPVEGTCRHGDSGTASRSLCQALMRPSGPEGGRM